MKRSRLAAWLKMRVVPPLGAWIIRGLRATMRVEMRGEAELDALYREGRNVVIAFWHAQQLLMPYAYRGKGLRVLISQHGDGEIIARIIARFGMGTVRGSSTRGGAAALRELIRVGRAGTDIAVTPDGPKGPRQEAKLGVVQLAKAAELPIVPLVFACSKKNSSRVGIASWSPILFRAGCFSMGAPYGFRVTPMRPSWKPSACGLSPS